MIETACRSCQGSNLETVHAFRETPYGDSYLDSKKKALDLECHRLTLGRCINCHLLQILETTNLETQYGDYLYFTRVTYKLRDFYHKVSNNLSSQLNLTKDDLLLDIGSNDGTFLSCFKSKSLRVIGVDPSRPACEMAKEKGIHTINSFFNSEVAEIIKSQFGVPRLVTCNYTIANVPSLADFLKSGLNYEF